MLAMFSLVFSENVRRILPLMQGHQISQLDFLLIYPFFSMRDHEAFQTLDDFVHAVNPNYLQVYVKHFFDERDVRRLSSFQINRFRSVVSRIRYAP